MSTCGYWQGDQPPCGKHAPWLLTPHTATHGAVERQAEPACELHLAVLLEMLWDIPYAEHDSDDDDDCVSVTVTRL